MKITLELMKSWNADADGINRFAAHPELEGAEHTHVCSVLEADGASLWSVWVRCNVAQHGSDEDRKALRGDPSSLVRYALAECGSEEDCLALLDDSNVRVRGAVAKRCNQELSDRKENDDE